jgi:rhodanese-related sulfurtransferase
VRGRRPIDDLVRAARASLVRLTPAEAWAAAGAGAVIVDTRSEDERVEQGVVVPGALHHPLSVVHWRLDPAVPTRNPKLSLDTHVVLVCRQGYSSSLAARLLQEVGFARATDVIGGIERWRRDGLPLDAHPGAT